ncbi:MAG TPA: hypothetical protein VN786_01230, partial [Acidimicrobiales bacterium]|nr:hypothetical protein [Acidimicrobiales bacterium]
RHAPGQCFELAEEPHLHSATLWSPPWPRLGSLNTALICRPQRDGSGTSGAGRTLFVTPEHRRKEDQ